MIKTYLFIEGPGGGDPFALRGAAAAEAALAAVPGLSGYIQTRALDDQIGDEPAAFAGAMELWFRDADAALASTDHALSMQPMLADGFRIGPIITGVARTVIRLPEHHTGAFIKGVFPFRRRADLSVADFQHHWWLKHGPIAALTEDAVYYLQCHPLLQLYDRGRPPFDGVTELHWPSVAAARSAMSSRQMTEDQAGDAKNFVDTDSVVLFLAEEEVVLAV